MSELSVYAGTADGRITSFDYSSYSDARGGIGDILTAYTNDTADWTVGQLKIGYYYYCIQAFYPFDTSGLGSGVTLTGAKFSLVSFENNSNTDFDMNLYVYDFGETVTSADFRTGTQLAAMTRVASRNTSDGFTVGTRYEWTLSDLSGISKTGTTYLMLASKNQADNVAPTDYEGVKACFANNATEGNRPKLVVTYSAAATFCPQCVLI